jgi:hypothetical protein
MNEADLRELVREAIARHVGPATTVGASAPTVAGAFRQHSSHALFALPTGVDGDGPCLIEPAVACNHCGYCKSYGN